LGAFTAQPALATQNSDDSRLLTTSRDSIKNGDFRAALIQLKKAVKANPNNPDARFELGFLEFRGSDFVAAEKDFLQAQEFGYPAAKVKPLLANTYLIEGKYQVLLDTVLPCSDDLTCKSDVLALRARADMALRKTDEADKESIAALDAAPNSETSRTTRAIVLIMQNDKVGATRLIDDLLAINPNNSEALTIKGDLDRQANDLDGAVKNYRAALDIMPKDARTRQSLAMALMAAGHDDEAKEEIDQVLKQTPTVPMAIYLKAVLLVRAKKTAEALDVVRPMEAAISQIPQGTFLLALVHLGSNNLEEALNYAAKFHAAEPDNMIGVKLLAKIDLRLHDYDKVISLLAPMHDRLVGDSEASGWLVSAYLAEGRIKDANDLLNDAVIAQPNDQVARARLAVSRTQLSATREEGIRDLESIVLNDPKNSQIDLALVSAYIGNGDYDHAIAAATTMAKNQPDSSLPLTLRGAAQLAKGDDQKARTDFESALVKNADFIPAVLYLAELNMQADKADESRRLLDAVLLRNPSDLSALIVRAKIEIRSNNPTAAIPFLEKAISYNPTKVEPRMEMMRLQIVLGEIDKASQTAKDLALTQSTDPAVVNNAARALLQMGKTDDALTLYRQMIKDFPQSPQSFENYGVALAAIGKQEEARDALDKAIALDRRDLSAWVNRIALEQKMNGLDAAMVIAEKAVLMNPTNPASLVLPGDLYMAAGMLDKAEDYYRKAYEQKPSSLTVFRLFKATAQKGNNAAADALLEAWIAKNPTDDTLRLILASHKSSEGDYRNAAAQYEAVLSRMPRNSDVINNLAWTYGHLGDLRAVAFAKRAYFMSPETPAYMDTYGYLLYQSGAKPQGMMLVRRAFDSNPRNPQVAYHMATLLADNNDSKKARIILKGVVESKVNFDGEDKARELYTKLSGS